MQPSFQATAALLFGMGSALFTASTPAVAQEGIAVIDRIFSSAGLNAAGTISRRESVIYIDTAFVSMGGDAKGELTLEEARQWDPGYFVLAQELDRMNEFNAAKEAVFSSRDLNGDGTMEYDEYSVSSLYDFDKADMNDERGLSQDEFIGEFHILNEVRSALE